MPESSPMIEDARRKSGEKNLQELREEVIARSPSSPVPSTQRQIIEKWAQDMAKMCEPSHEAGWGIYADWLTAFASALSPVPSSEIRFELGEIHCPTCAKQTPQRRFGDVVRCSECGNISATLTSTPANNWNDAFPARPPSRGTEPEDFEKLLDDLIFAANGGISSQSPSSDQDVNTDVALSAIRGYVSRLQSERDVLREWKTHVLNALESKPDFQEAEWAGDKRGWGFVFEYINWLHREVAALSRIQQTGLTAEEAEALLQVSEFGGISPYRANVWKAGLEKLRSLAALRSLEGDRGK